MFGPFKRSPPKWCCMGFEGNYQAAGERGFAVLVGKEGFLIQVRLVAQNEAHRLKIEPQDIAVSLVNQIGMRFCPWCGANLAKFYGNRLQELERPEYPIRIE